VGKATSPKDRLRGPKKRDFDHLKSCLSSAQDLGRKGQKIRGRPLTAVASSVLDTGSHFRAVYRKKLKRRKKGYQGEKLEPRTRGGGAEGPVHKERVSKNHQVTKHSSWGRAGKGNQERGLKNRESQTESRNPNGTIILETHSVSTDEGGAKGKKGQNEKKKKQFLKRKQRAKGTGGDSQVGQVRSKAAKLRSFACLEKSGRSSRSARRTRDPQEEGVQNPEGLNFPRRPLKNAGGTGSVPFKKKKKG